MSLTPATRLGPYEIVSALGAGGMGEVYRARDTKLKREVAIKVLPQAFARDEERMKRFEREAQVLASLNHPNVASIYGIEEADGVRALCWSWWKGRLSPSGWLPVGFPWKRRSASRLRSPRDSKRRMRRRSSIGT
jgi:hypothetical protein